MVLQVILEILPERRTIDLVSQRSSGNKDRISFARESERYWRIKYDSPIFFFLFILLDKERKCYSFNALYKVCVLGCSASSVSSHPLVSHLAELLFKFLWE